MYSYIKGTLEEIYEDRVVVENNGIGYQMDVPATLIGRLPSIGEIVKIYTYLHVKEDCFSLFGFLTRDELNIFKMMLNVSGIGPKGALGILSTLSPDQLRVAVASDDAKAIAKSPGIGSKTAQKLIIELKDKIKLEDVIEHAFEQGQPVQSEKTAALISEAVEALTSLGYSIKEAKEVVGMITITEDMNVEAILKAALKNMAFL